MNINNLKLLEQLYPKNSTEALNQAQDTTIDSLQEGSSDPFSEVLTNSITQLEDKQLASDHAIQGLVS